MKKIVYSLEKEIVKIILHGIIKPESIIHLISDVVRDKKNLPDHLRIMLDSRRAKYEIKPSELTAIYKKFMDHHKDFTVIKLTVIQQSPYETAISIIMKEMFRGVDNVYFEVFSSEKAAVLWLN